MGIPPPSSPLEEIKDGFRSRYPKNSEKAEAKAQKEILKTRDRVLKMAAKDARTYSEEDKEEYRKRMHSYLQADK